MSQIHSPTQVNPPPPSNPTMFATDDGTAIPLVNTLNIGGVQSEEDSPSGILTRANPDLSNNLEIVLTNRVSGVGSTNSNTPADITVFDCGSTPGVYNFDIQIVGYDLTDLAGCGYFISGSVRTTGLNAVLVGTPDKIVNEEAATSGCDANLVVAGNNAVVRVTGLSGKSINWRVLSQYIFVS